MTTYRETMSALLRGDDMTRDQAAAIVAEMMAGELGQPQTAALLTGLAIKGVTADELSGMATAMRQAAVPLPGFEDAIDTCGTGGSGMNTANTSTMCAFVVAAAGARVAKHGNRSSSGKCGSADVLERLGVHFATGPEPASELLNRVGIAFLFAPTYHPAMRHVVPVRRSVGFRTVFNFLGPLCNPAGTRKQLLGVSDARMAELMARALADMGCERAMVVHGDDGLDELSISGSTRVWHVRGQRVETASVEPGDVGLVTHPFETVAGGDIETNTALFQAILGGTGDKPRTDHLLLNAGAALHVAGVSESVAAGVDRARQLIESGAAWQRFEAFRAASNELASAA